MSNHSLIARIESTLAAVRSGEASSRAFADTLRGNGRALEGMTYPLIKEMESLAMDLEIAQWQDEDGCLPELTAVLIRLEAWLRQVPKDSA